jgi:hypothetical protein
MFAGRKQKRYQRSSKSAGHPSQTPGAHSQPDTNAQMPAGKLARAAVFSALPSMNQASKPQSHQASLSGRCTTHPAALAPKTQPKNATQSSNPLTPSSSPRSFAALRSKAALATQPTCPGENKRARQSPCHSPPHPFPHPFPHPAASAAPHSPLVHNAVVACSHRERTIISLQIPSGVWLELFRQRDSIHRATSGESL